MQKERMRLAEQEATDYFAFQAKKSAAELADQRKLSLEKRECAREEANAARRIDEAKLRRHRQLTHEFARDDFESKTREPIKRGGSGWLLPYNREYYVNVETVYDSMLHQYPRQNNDSYAYMLRIIENRAQDIYLERKGVKPTRFMGKGFGVVLLCLKEEADIIKEAVKTVYRERYGDPQQPLLPFARESSASSASSD